MSDLSQLEDLSIEEMKTWLEQALRGRKALTLAVPDEPPFLAIARQEDSLERVTRKDLRKSISRLIAGLARDRDEDDDYVVGLIGLAVELDVQEATSALSGIAQAEDFDRWPARQQAAVLGALIDLHYFMQPDFWTEMLRTGRNVPLAFRALVEQGPGGVKLLAMVGAVGEDVADALYVVLSQHAKRLDPNLRDLLIRNTREVLAQCSGEVGIMLGEWLAEQDEAYEPTTSAGDLRQAQAFFDAFPKRHGSPQLQRFPSDARLAAA